jgi:predicted nuclease of predicted toxin-antitoxin system
VRFLVDESLQRHVADLLVDNGHDAVHVSDIGLRGAPDETVLAAADADSRVLITADTDFGTLLALSGAEFRHAVTATGIVRQNRTLRGGEPCHSPGTPQRG